MYHRFAARPAWRKVDVATFDAHLVFLRQHYEIVSLDTLVDLLRFGEPLNPRAVAITVDDAYEDFHRLALPILEKHGLPATLFVPTDFVDGQAWLWPDLLLWMIRETRRDWVEVEEIGRVDLGTLAQRRLAWNTVADWLLELSQVDRSNRLWELAARLDVTAPKVPTADYRPMSWDQVRDAVGRGIAIGSQACQHIPLARETPEVQLREARASRERLEARTGKSVRHFSYPHGRLEDFSDATVDAAIAAGYLSAAAAVPFIDSANLLFRLPRLSAPEATADLELALSGMSELFGRKA